MLSASLIGRGGECLHLSNDRIHRFGRGKGRGSGWGEDPVWARAAGRTTGVTFPSFLELQGLDRVAVFVGCGGHQILSIFTPWILWRIAINFCVGLISTCDLGRCRIAFNFINQLQDFRCLLKGRIRPRVIGGLVVSNWMPQPCWNSNRGGFPAPSLVTKSSMWLVTMTILKIQAATAIGKTIRGMAKKNAKHID